MKEIILNILKVLVLLLVVAGLFFIINNNTESQKGKSNSSLIIFGDTIDKSYKPVIENDKIYISFDTIEQFIDEDIFYDKDVQKVIITNEDAVYKFRLNDSFATKNFKSYNANGVCKLIDNEVYVDLDLVKDIYNFKSEYDEQTDTISIDKKDDSDIHLNYNNVNLYSDISTNSNVLETLSKTNTVTVYVDSLKHNRWYKVKSDSGKIGYIEKGAVTPANKTDNNEEDNQEENKEKLIMFWQYGSNLDTLGDKIEGVNVVMPTWFSVSNDDGTISMKYSKEYHDKAKSYGYEVWPIITNSFDSSDIDSKELTSEIMNDEYKREALIENIVNIVKQYNLDGINVDFESMKEEDKYMYTQFLRELYPMLRSVNAKLSVDVYFTNYIDRKGVGKACDYLMLMGYDQRGSWSNDAGSIAEVTWVEKNINSLINDSEVEPSRIVVGIPFYTRIWRIKDNGTMNTSIYSMQDSKDFLTRNNLDTKWDEVAGQNYAEIKVDDTIYKLWIEDSMSVAKRAELVTKYNLAGITAWQKGFETSDVWTTLYEKLK